MTFVRIYCCIDRVNITVSLSHVPVNSEHSACCLFSTTYGLSLIASQSSVMPLRINKMLSVLIFWATLYMTLSENNSCFHDMPCTSDVFSDVKIILITILKVFFRFAILDSVKEYWFPWCPGYRTVLHNTCVKFHVDSLKSFLFCLFLFLISVLTVRCGLIQINRWWRRWRQRPAT